MAGSNANRQQWNASRDNGDTVEPIPIDPATGAVKTTTSGGGGGGAATIADGADVAEGAIADAAVAAGATGTLSAKLRAISRDIASLFTGADGTNVTQGAIADAAVAAGAAGTISAKLRRLTTDISALLTTAIPTGSNVIGAVTEQWGVLSSGILLLTGDGTAPTLKNLAGGALVLSGIFDNTALRVANANLDLRLRGQAAFVATTLDIWILPSLDGAVYEDGDVTITPARSADASFSLRGITTAQILILTGLQIPPTKVKFLVKLNGTITLTNTNGENTLTLYTNP